MWESYSTVNAGLVMWQQETDEAQTVGSVELQVCPSVLSLGGCLQQNTVHNNQLAWGEDIGLKNVGWLCSAVIMFQNFPKVIKKIKKYSL